MAAKSKTLVFNKNEDFRFDSVDEIIDELNPMNYVNVTAKIEYKIDGKQTSRNFSLREYFLSDGNNFMAVAMFEDLKDSMEVGNTGQDF